MTLRQKLLIGAERVLGVLVVALLLGTSLAFGGAVWWAPVAIAVLCALLVAATLSHILLEGSVRVLKSPLMPLALLALGLALAQVATLPPAVAGRLSPRSREIYALGMIPDRVRELDPSMATPDPASGRSPISVDRGATLRWLAGASACLALFWGVTRYTDRLERLFLVWGSIVAAFGINTVFAVVQVACGVKGLYGFIDPGAGPAWAPSLGDLSDGPNVRVLRALAEPAKGHPGWVTLIPDHPFSVGTMLGGAPAYLALGSIGLPLALALLLQLLAPRGSREGLLARLGHSGQGGLVLLLTGLVVAGGFLVGLLSGPVLAAPFALALLIVGLPSIWATGLRWAAAGLTFLSVLTLGSGVLVGDLWARLPGVRPPVTPEGFATALRVWSDARGILRDFPIFGTGLGSFASIYPLYKTQDLSPTTALSSLLQWWVESGFFGLAIVVVAGLWCLLRTPGAVRRVGTADRALAFGLIGAIVGFTLYSALHWTVELVAVALAASALAGIGNRWLSGGTDLFVERG